MSAMIGNPLLLGGGDYEISRSVRLRSSATAYFTRTLSASNRKTWTWSAWVKRGLLANRQALFSAGLISGTFHYHTIHFDSNDKLNVVFYPDTTSTTLITTQVFRDPSAWYHLVVTWDTTQATASNRIRIYVNGSQATNFDTATYSAQNTDGYINSAAYNSGVHNIGRFTPSDTAYLDGYLTDINFIDGQALTPSSFGETDAITGVWKPKKYAGTYGTNGFYLNFSDPSAATAAAIGKDYSGNGNNWTPNNISVTSGVTYDSMLDVPTPWADGGNGRGNYAVLNPLATSSSGTASFTNGNLTANGPGTAAYRNIESTMQVASGKWYWEVSVTTLATDAGIGIGTGGVVSFREYLYNGNKSNGTVSAAYGASYTTGDVIGVALDMDGNSLTFYKNGVSQGIAYTDVVGLTSVQAVGYIYGTGVQNYNFGQRPFAYTPPSGFKALQTGNLPEPVIKKGNAYFNTVLYTGNGTGQTVSGVGFQPDFVWGKSRTQIRNHNLYDAVRGAGNMLLTNGTNAELTGGELSAFTSDGFTLGSNVYQMNPSGDSMVAWNWKESATAGFDIVTYTGNGDTSGTRAIAHNLGVAPKVIISKSRSATGDWVWWTTVLGGMKYLVLNTTAAVGNAGETAPTSSNFYVGGNNVNGVTYVAYLFAEVAGFSKFGSYTGNGSADGPFVFCGFRPAFVLVKASSATENWLILDSATGSYNVIANTLLPNSSAAESTGNNRADFLANGFKCRASGGVSPNASGVTYIYAAFAERPFKNSLAR